jgi:TRAP transporter 4TM/12TM fusion protein
VPYAQVALWALIPAILYYVAVFFAVHFEAKRHGLHGVPKADLPRLGRVMIERGHLFIPILIILAGLLAGYSAPLCALVATLACLPVALLRKTTRAGITWKSVPDALIYGAQASLSVAVACAAAGIVIGAVTITGASIGFTQFVIALAQDTLVLALILTAFASLVLGLGLPTTPAYIVSVALLVPALMKLGAPAPAAHMFSFYFAILSAITPPVALAVFAAAALAKADQWSAGWAAMRIAAVAYFVPFMFVYEPALLMLKGWAEWDKTAFACVSAIIGCIGLASGLHGYLFTVARMWERALLAVGGVLLIAPELYSSLIGLSMLSIAGGAQLARRRAATALS